MMMLRMGVVVTVMGRRKILSFILICILLMVGLILVSGIMVVVMRMMLVVMRMMLVVMRMMVRMMAVVMSGSRSCVSLLWFVSVQLTCG